MEVLIFVFMIGLKSEGVNIFCVCYIEGLDGFVFFVSIWN